MMNSYSVPANTVQVRSGVERATLVRRTYALVFASVIVTVLATAFALGQPRLLLAVAQHPFIAMICMFAPLYFAMRSHRSFPTNLGFTFLFNIAEGFFLAPVIAMYAARNGPGILGQAAFLTLSTFGALSLYAVVSRRDFSAWGGFFMIGLWVLIATSILNIFFKSALASLWIAGATILVFGGLLVYDTWRIVRSGRYGEDDYVLAAVQIYLDLLNLFLAILTLLGGRRRE